MTETSSPSAGRHPGGTEELPSRDTTWRGRIRGQADGAGSTALPSVYVLHSHGVRGGVLQLSVARMVLTNNVKYCSKIPYYTTELNLRCELKFISCVMRTLASVYYSPNLMEMFMKIYMCYI